MNYKEITIISRTDGATEKAMLFLCDQCGNDSFTIYMVKDHPHLQCTECDTTHCQGNCDGVSKHHAAQS